MLLQALLALIIFLPYQPALTPPSLKDKTMLQKVLAMDWIGTLLTMGLTITFLLPLFWGGNRYAWNDPVVIALFVVVGPFCRDPVFLLTPRIVWCPHHHLRSLGDLSLSTRFIHSASGSCSPVQEQNNRRNDHLHGVHILVSQYPYLLFASVLPNRPWSYRRAIRS